MSTKGTGWVPDFPDVKDYTLNSEQIQALAGQVQTDQVTGSVENLTKQVNQALKLLTIQSTAATKDLTEQVNQLLQQLTTQPTEGTKIYDRNEAPEELEKLIEKLDRKASGGIYFAPAKINKVLKLGMSDPDVIRIKKYLNLIYPPGYDQYAQYSHQDNDLNLVFDEKTKSLVEEFQASINLPEDGMVDEQTMNALMWSQHLKENLRDNSKHYNYIEYLDIVEAEDIETLIRDLESKPEQIFSYSAMSPETVEATLNNLISLMKRCRENVKTSLEAKGVKLTSIVVFWLNSSDDDEGLIVTEIETVKKELESTGYSKTLSAAIKNFVYKLKEIPCFLQDPHHNFFEHKNKEENIESQIPERLFEIVLTKIIKDPAFHDLMRPVAPYEFSMDPRYSESTGWQPPCRSSYSFRKQNESASKLVKQLKALGVSSQGGTSLSQQASFMVSRFNYINNLQVIADVSVDCGMAPAPTPYFYNDDVCKQLINNLRQKSNQLIYPIAKAILSVIMPLGQYNNLDKALDAGLEIFNNHVGKAPSEESKNVIVNKSEIVNLFWKSIWETIGTLERHLEKDAISEVIQDLKNYQNEIKEDEEVKTVSMMIEMLETSLYSERGAIKVAVDLIKGNLRSEYGTHVWIDDTEFDVTTYGEPSALDDDIAANTRARFRTVIGTIKDLENRKDNVSSIYSFEKKRIDYQGDNFLYLAICDLINDYLAIEKCPSDLFLDQNIAKTEIFTSKKSLVTVLDSEASQELEKDLQIPLGWDLHQRVTAQQQAFRNQGQFENNLDPSIYLSLPDIVDLSLWCSSIEDQGLLNSCTAQAGVALTEYFAKKTSGKYIDVSPLFLYKAARNLMHRQGDTGASVRETMKAMVLFGIPPEEDWPYDEEKYDEEPTSFCYSYAQNYQALKYFRIDHAGITNDTLLVQIKAVLVAGFPCMFGFTIYTSIHDEVNMEKGHIPYPSQFDKMEGGHAVVAVGYDDHRVIENADSKRSEGAILIRNSWGTDWGAGGYGWLPYDYILAGLTADWWSLFQSEWFESGQFGVGASNWASDMGGRRKSGRRR